MNTHGEEKLNEALTEFFGEKRNNKRRGASVFPVFAMALAAVFLSVASFFLYQGEDSGGFAAAKEVFQGFLEENEAIAVFLGLGEGNEMR